MTHPVWAVAGSIAVTGQLGRRPVRPGRGDHRPGPDPDLDEMIRRGDATAAVHDPDGTRYPVAKRKKRPPAKTGARRTAAPVRVAAGPSWGVIGLYAAAGVVVALIIGFGVYALTRNGGDTNPSVPSTSDIAGLVDYRVSEPAMLTNNHVQGSVAYPVGPPVGGDHNPAWQNCMGEIYPQPIANENAVHSLEHGAVWITYRPDLPADRVAALAAKVRNTPYLMLSPYPDLDRPVSLQAWGYQLKLDSATDPRVDRFIQAFRISAAPEPGALCSGGTTATGTQPHSTPG